MHVRASNTEPIVRVIAEAAEPAQARELARADRPLGRQRLGGAAMSQTGWPTFERPPAVAFVDVDGTLLAQTTTFLFARILYRRGWIRRSFFLRGLYHGLQHRFGRLDYGRLIAIGLKTSRGFRSSSWNESPMRILWNSSGPGSTKGSSTI